MSFFLPAGAPQDPEEEPNGEVELLTDYATRASNFWSLHFGELLWSVVFSNGGHFFFQEFLHGNLQ